MQKVTKIRGRYLHHIAGYLLEKGSIVRVAIRHLLSLTLGLGQTAGEHVHQAGLELRSFSQC